MPISQKEFDRRAGNLAYWFFRLNGCFTFKNFIVHPDDCGSQRTDVDIIALRFLHRQELMTSNQPMEDHRLFKDQEKYASVFFVEIKRGECDLNGPWRDPQKKNIQRVLNAMGLVPENNVEAASAQLYENYRFNQDNIISILFAMVGKTRSSRRDCKDIPQLTWNEILRWMHSRYVDYEAIKAHHPQWDDEGRKLYKHATRNGADVFVAHWLQQAGISDC